LQSHWGFLSWQLLVIAAITNSFASRLLVGDLLAGLISCRARMMLAGLVPAESALDDASRVRSRVSEMGNRSVVDPAGVAVFAEWAGV